MNEAILKGVTCVICGAELRISLACSGCGDNAHVKEDKILSQGIKIIDRLLNQRPWSKDLIDAAEKFVKEN